MTALPSLWRGSIPVAMCAFFLLAGCGTMNGGSTKTISVRSDPAGAMVTAQPSIGEYQTPVTLVLKRKNTYTLIASKAGYHDSQFRIRKVRRVGVFAADVFLSLMLVGVPAIVDASTGGWWDLQPDDAVIALHRMDDSVDGPEVITISLSAEKLSSEGVLAVTSDETVTIRVMKD